MSRKEIVNQFASESIESLETQLDVLLDSRPQTQIEKDEKWAEVSQLKYSMTEKTRESGNYYREEVTKAVLLEYIQIRIDIDNQLIASYHKSDCLMSVQDIEELNQYNLQKELLSRFREKVTCAGDAEIYDLWLYFWEELLESTVPVQYVKPQ